MDKRANDDFVVVVAMEASVNDINDTANKATIHKT
jgi:hypothetical protein